MHVSLSSTLYISNINSSTMDHILRLTIAFLSFSMLASTLFPMCDAMYHGRAILRGHRIHRSTLIKSSKKLKMKSLKRLSKYSSFDSFGFSDFDSYGSPSSLPLPPYNSLPPSSSSTAPPLAPPTTGGVGNPNLPAFSPLPSPPYHGPPSPRSIVASSPPPPSPYSSSSPPKHSPSPPGPPKSVPSQSPPPLVYLPPVVFPPPPSPSTHRKKPPQYALWCVAKPTVPDPIIQEAMDYACGSGADCKSIQPNGLCFQPNTLLSHASFAFNSYWQNTKIGGGTCDFGGTAMLVTVDPSYDKCNFMLT